MLSGKTHTNIMIPAIKGLTRDLNICFNDKHFFENENIINETENSAANVAIVAPNDCQ